MTYPRCEHCGRVDAAWSRGHAPKCPEYESPEPVQTCAVCGGPARVRDVAPLEAVVIWECPRCALTWTDDVLLVEELRWTDDDEPADEPDDLTRSAR